MILVRAPSVGYMRTTTHYLNNNSRLFIISHPVVAGNIIIFSSESVNISMRSN